MTQSNSAPDQRDDDLETIKEIMMTVARRCDAITEIQQQNTYAIADTRRDFQWLDRKIDRNATAIERLTDRIDRMAEDGNRRYAAIDERLDRITEIQARTDERLDRIAQKQDESAALIQTNALAVEALAESIIQMQNQIQQIWERIQEILTELRNRFPGNGRG